MGSSKAKAGTTVASGPATTGNAHARVARERIGWQHTINLEVCLDKIIEYFDQFLSGKAEGGQAC